MSQEDSVAAPSQDEAHCMQVFVSWLRDKQPHSQLEWEYIPVHEQTNKPDFFLTADGVKYSVEHTNVNRMENVDGQPMGYSTISSGMSDFLTEVRSEANKEGALDGPYALYIQHPISGFTAARGKLKRAILDYIKATSGIQAGAPIPLMVKGRDIGRVERLASAGEDVGIYLVGPFNSRFGSAIPREVCKLLDEAVTKKRGKLQQKRLELPAILLLFDKFPFAQPETWFECVPHIAEISYFHTVFLVWGHAGLVLYSQEISWLAGY